ncbi:tRNA (5-methylaminomethyl-2-thiouridine)(34)-methyltransferase MnmD, partial [Ottowia sp.]|uniref:tRNA (5-methylaminomethyl-2-thiouridine)(34)-methyltransferase MnmD n=1 Tax=Ottowia sp. TaxID=1898956 RepID=UPI0039E52F72
MNSNPEPAVVHWRDDGTPVSPRYGDIFRSAGAGLDQARHVFLHGCGLVADGDAPTAWADRPVWQILETGFGLGLNFLATWRAWLDDPQRPARLFYSAVEAHPPEAADLLRSAAPYPDLVPLAEQLAAQWRGLLPGLHRIELADGALQLTLAVGDARALLPELTGRFDSVFLDGFDPRKNPAMWSADVLRAVARLCRPGARAATWCVAGEVRERLAACGFEVARVPGLPPKRHALVARYAPRHTPRRRARPGEVLPMAAPGRCAIVGAGLAGASLAHVLAARGWQVTVLGEGREPADGASALPAGVFAPHVSPDDRPLSRLTRAGCAATLARARALLREGIDFAESGVLERHAPGERRRPEGWNTTESIAASALSTGASGQLRAEIGLPGDDEHPALWHAGAGWVRPAALVRALLAAPGIRFAGGAR